MRWVLWSTVADGGDLSNVMMTSRRANASNIIGPSCGGGGGQLFSDEFSLHKDNNEALIIISVDFNKVLDKHLSYRWFNSLRPSDAYMRQ